MTGYGNNYTCAGTYVCGYQCDPAEGSEAGGTGGVGAGGANGSCAQGAQCSSKAVSPQVTSNAFSSKDTAVTFSDGSQSWTTYTYAATGQTAPTVAPDADQLSIQAQVLASDNVPGAFVGLGLYFANPACADISAYHAIRFTLSGNLGGCALRFFAEQSADVHVTDDSVRGRCAEATCYGPSFDVAASGDVTVALSDFKNGVPCPSLDPRTVVSLNWFFHLPDGATTSDSCATSVVLSHVQFVE